MANPGSESELTVAEREAQRIAEQEALRNVRKLTDALEEEQRERRKWQKWGLLIGVIAVLVLVFAFVSVYVKSRTAPPPQKIDVPAKIELPKK
jgi:cell division protein FtsL